MKKHLLIFTVMLISISVIAFCKTFSDIFQEKAVNKEISLSIYSDNQYTSQAYDEALAKVHVTVTKVSRSKRTVVWEKDYDNLQLKKYPSMNNAYEQVVEVPNVLDKKEKLEVSYTITYNSKGSVLQIANGAVIDGKVSKEKLQIAI